MKKITIFDKSGKIIVKQLVREDVRKYFKTLAKPTREVGTYCQRCGKIFGEYDFISARDKSVKHAVCEEKKGIKWKEFILCSSCLEDKILGRQEATPDLEDLQRFNVKL